MNLLTHHHGCHTHLCSFDFSIILLRKVERISSRIKYALNTQARQAVVFGACGQSCDLKLTLRPITHDLCASFCRNYLIGCIVPVLDTVLRIIKITCICISLPDSGHGVAAQSFAISFYHRFRESFDTTNAQLNDTEHTVGLPALIADSKRRYTSFAQFRRASHKFVPVSWCINTSGLVSVKTCPHPLETMNVDRHTVNLAIERTAIEQA